MYTKEQIQSEYLKGNSKRYSETSNEEIQSFIENSINLPISHKEKVYCFLNDITPKCKNPDCNTNKFPRFENFKIGYKDYCCKKCVSIHLGETQIKTRLENRNINNTKIIEGLTAKEIIKGIYECNIDIKNWKSLPVLKEFTHFRSLEQLYKHLILNDNQECEFCGRLLNYDPKTKVIRSCNCKTQEEKLLLNLDKNVIGIDFINFIIENKLHYKIKKCEELLLKEYKERVGEFLPFTFSLIEDMYCRLNNIKENPNAKFVSLTIGYKKEEIIIDYSLPIEEIIEQLNKKYTYRYTVNEYREYLDSKISDSISYQEKEYILINGEESIGKCKVCGKKTTFNKNKYRNYCSVKCVNIGEGEKNKQKSIEKFRPVIEKRLFENNLILLESYRGMKEYHKIKCLTCDSVFKGLLSTTSSICRTCTPKLSGISNKEKEVLEFIQGFYKGEIIENYRELGKEFDIFIPEKKIAIEFNGLYWHSSQFKEKNYHLEKTELAENNDIQLLHIFENEWDFKQDIVKSVIKAKLGFTSDKVYARKCIIKEVPSKESNEFLLNNHLQGKDNAPIRYGLYFNDELIQLITFKRSHRSKSKYLELKRSCSKIGINVVGGFSKLLKYSQNILKEDIITFADRRYSYKDNAYSKNGFELVSVISPNYSYKVGNELKSREQYQKHKLKKVLEIYDSDLTEKENMHINDYFEIYDSGNFKYIYRY